ncbi:MAG: hypothetical protein AAF840_16605, partial [Bacteroidota bacterium]
MKIIYQFCSYLFFFAVFQLHAQSDITFSVDMSGVEVSPDGVSVTWASSTASSLNEVSVGAMLDGDGDNVYSATYSVASQTFGYFFVNGDVNDSANFETVPDECSNTVELFGVTLTVRPQMIASGSTVDLETVCFSACEACPLQALVTFQVNTALTMIDSEGMFIAGSFSGFQNIAMEDPDGDGIWSVQIPLNQG